MPDEQLVVVFARKSLHCLGSSCYSPDPTWVRRGRPMAPPDGHPDAQWPLPHAPVLVSGRATDHSNGIDTLVFGDSQHRHILSSDGAPTGSANMTAIGLMPASHEVTVRQSRQRRLGHLQLRSTDH